MSATIIQPTSEVITSSGKHYPMRLAFLDGVRGMAAFYVLLHHSRISTLGDGSLPGIRGFISNWLQYGHLAVDVFIVLSGFCLILPVAKHGELRGGSLAFFRRRAWRILPPMLASIALALAIRWPMQLRQQDFLTTPFKMLATNVFLLQDLIPNQNTLNDPLWSVAVEWKIYFLFPLFAWLWAKRTIGPLRGPEAVLALSAVIGYGLTVLISAWFHGAEMDHTCPWYVMLFGIGLCAGGAVVRDKVPEGKFWNDRWVAMTVVAAIATTVLLTAYPYTPNIMPVLDPAVGVLAAGILLLLARAQNLGKTNVILQILSWRPFVMMGIFGYSIYLAHGTFLSAFEKTISPLGLAPVPYFLAVVFIGAPLIIGCCYLFFLAFEKRYLQKRTKETVDELARDAALSPAP